MPNLTEIWKKFNEVLKWVKKNWQTILMLGGILIFLLLLLRITWKLARKKICIKCEKSQYAEKFWIEIKPSLGICHTCIIRSLFGTKNQPGKK